MIIEVGFIPGVMVGFEVFNYEKNNGFMFDLFIVRIIFTFGVN